MGDNATFENNSANGTKSSLGGAIYNNTIAILGRNASFKGNKSEEKGGAIFNTIGTVIIGENAKLDSNFSNVGGGGALFNKSNVIFKDGAKFEANYSSKNSGGAIYNTVKGTSAGSLIFGAGTTFKANEARGSAGQGGALYNNGGAVDFGSRVTFDTNSPVTQGGAVYHAGDKTVSFGQSAIFTKNKSGSDGGAIYNSGTIVFKNGVKFEGNNANNGSGGAIYSGGNVVLCRVSKTNSAKKSILRKSQRFFH